VSETIDDVTAELDYEYDPLGRLSLAIWQTAGEIVGTTYSYDLVGNRTSMDRTGASWTAGCAPREPAQLPQLNS